MMTITPERMQAYKEGARARKSHRMQEIEDRRQRALEVASEAARELKTKFGATSVILYGSLAHGNWFSARSDIDLAAAGIAPEQFWRAWCALDRIDRTLEIELIALESAPGPLLRQIMQEGITL